MRRSPFTREHTDRPARGSRSAISKPPPTSACAHALLAVAGVALLFVGLSPSALGWGKMAHRASAKLAEARLSRRTHEAIKGLLDEGESLADASTWADENSRSIPGSASWHYVNVPVTAARYDPQYCRKSGCVVSKIPEYRAVLLDRHAPRARRQTALRLLVHLIQDVHQPMHVADRNDRGGNDLQLRYGRFEGTNLHQLWDSGLLRERFAHEDQLVRALEERANQPAARGWLKGGVEDWANESLELGRRAYLVPGSTTILRSGATISREYEQENLPLAVDRVARSGVRLAAMLNDIFDPPRGGNPPPGRGKP
jgi:hypothetical protein